MCRDKSYLHPYPTLNQTHTCQRACFWSVSAPVGQLSKCLFQNRSATHFDLNRHATSQTIVTIQKLKGSHWHTCCRKQPHSEKKTWQNRPCNCWSPNKGTPRCISSRLQCSAVIILQRWSSQTRSCRMQLPGMTRHWHWATGFNRWGRSLDFSSDRRLCQIPRTLILFTAAAASSSINSFILLKLKLLLSPAKLNKTLAPVKN